MSVVYGVQARARHFSRARCSGEEIEPYKPTYAQLADRQVSDAMRGALTVYLRQVAVAHPTVDADE